MNLRKAARGRDCQIRLEGVCNFNPETTVLAHIRMAGITGMGMKAPDLLGSWACSACHDVVDRRVRTDFERDYTELSLLRGVMRTQNLLLNEGAIKC